MCQRVNLALALCTQPKILIADEPTTALDVTTQKTVLDLIANLSKESGMAVLLVSHDLGALSERSDRLMVMYAGKAMEWGATSEIMTSPSHPYTRALLKAQPPISGPLPDKLELIHGQPPRLSKQHELCPFLNRCPSSIEACQKTMPSINGKSTHRRMCHLEDN
jgi:oligopeptide/dipeptide ABC transporter ATP-binding protein